MPKDYVSAIAAPSQAAFIKARDFGAAILRKTRHADFRLFREIALDFFNTPPSDARHARMTARNGFVVNEPVDEDSSALEIYYGARRVRQYERTPDDRAIARAKGAMSLEEVGYAARARWTTVLETGAALVYRQGDEGSVNVFLYPFRADRYGPEEDAIHLARYASLEALTGRGVLEQHWAYLRAYAETTSIDGEADWRDHLRVGWLRFSRRMVVAGRTRAARAAETLELSLGVAAAMCAAGFALSLFA